MSDLLLSCECHGYHYAEIWNDEDYGLHVDFIERPRGFRQKIQCIFDVLMDKQIYSGELIVKKEDYKKLLSVLKPAQPKKGQDNE